MNRFIHFITLFLLFTQDVNAKASKAAAKAVVKKQNVVKETKPRELSNAELAFAGAFATAFGVTLVHPIDTIKTLQMSNEGIGLNMLAATNKIMKVRSNIFYCSTTTVKLRLGY